MPYSLTAIAKSVDRNSDRHSEEKHICGPVGIKESIPSLIISRKFWKSNVKQKYKAFKTNKIRQFKKNGKSNLNIIKSL